MVVDDENTEYTIAAGDDVIAEANEDKAAPAVLPAGTDLSELAQAGAWYVGSSKTAGEPTHEDWQAVFNMRESEAQLTVLHLLAGSDELARASARRWCDLDNELTRIREILEARPID